jgi:hypothetical protein
VNVDADQQCVEAARTWHVTADDEFLFTISSMLDPSAGSLTCFVFRIVALADNTFQPQRSHPIKDLVDRSCSNGDKRIGSIGRSTQATAHLAVPGVAQSSGYAALRRPE